MKRTTQVLGYPLMLMLDLFEFPSSAERRPSASPKRATIHSVVAR